MRTLSLSAMLIALTAACTSPARKTVDLKTETLYIVEHSSGTDILTTEQRRTAQLIQKSHYENMNRTLAALRISARDKKDPKRPAVCELPSDFRLDAHPELRESFPGTVPIVKAQPIVFNFIQLAIISGLKRCEETMTFTPDSARDLDEQIRALLLENAGTPYCVVDSDCGAFYYGRLGGGPADDAPILSSRLTDPIFTLTFRKFRPALVRRLQGSSAQERFVRFRPPPGPEPETVCRENLCRLAAPRGSIP